MKTTPADDFQLSMMREAEANWARCQIDDVPMPVAGMIVEGYITDGPGYSGVVHVALWPGSPGMTTSYTLGNNGQLERCEPC